MLRSSYPLGKIEVSISHALFELLHSFAEVTSSTLIFESLLERYKHSKIIPSAVQTW